MFTYVDNVFFDNLFGGKFEEKNISSYKSHFFEEKNRTLSLSKNSNQRNILKPVCLTKI